MTKRGLRTVELGAVLAMLAIVGLLVLPAIRNTWMHSAEGKRRDLCAAHLKDWFTACTLYADEAREGAFPPNRADVVEELLIDLSCVYPQYLNNPSILICPSDNEYSLPGNLDALSPAERVTALEEANGSYKYLGWAFDRTLNLPEQRLPLGEAAPSMAKSAHDMSAILAKHGRLPLGMDSKAPQVCAQMACTLETVYRQTDPAARAEAVRKDAEVPIPHGNLGGIVVHRLGKGVARQLAAGDQPAPGEIEKRIPVMLDAFANAGYVAYFNHLPGGSNVLFLDGHVDFLRYPNTDGPVTESVGRLLGMLL